MVVKRSDEWMNMFKIVLTVACILITGYLPALLLALPDCVFSVQYECDKEDRAEAEQRDSGQDESAILRRNGYQQIIDASREEGGTSKLNHSKEEEMEATEIPVDDPSPVTCSALLRAYIQKLPDSRLSFNIKIAVMLYCILPSVLYVQIGLWLTLKKKYIHESFKKQVQLPGQSASSLYFYPFGHPALYVIQALTCLAVILLLRPKDLLFKHDMCFLCKKYLTVALPTVDFPRKSPDSIGNEVLCHLRRVQKLPAFVWITLTQRHMQLLEKLISFSTCSLSMVNRHASRIKRARCVLCVLFSTLLTIPVAVFGAICLSVLLLIRVSFLLVCCSPCVTLSVLSLPFQNAVYSKNVCTNKLRNRIVRSTFVTGILLAFVLPLLGLLYNSTSFVIYMIKFIMIGLYLNADIVTPYLAFFLVVATNVYLSYGNLQNRYTEFKGLILKYRQKTLNISNGDTIPTSLFWFVSNRVLPIATETCRMFCNMALIIMFLSLSLSAVLFFKGTYSISTVISSVSVFISGLIPALFFKRITKGKVFTGWEKIKMKRQIEIAMEEFDRERIGENSASSRGMWSLEMSYSDLV